MRIKTKFKWAEFKKYVDTYNPSKDGGNDANIILDDMLYGLGTSIHKKYKWHDGYKLFKEFLLTRLKA